MSEMETESVKVDARRIFNLSQNQIMACWIVMFSAPTAVLIGTLIPWGRDLPPFFVIQLLLLCLGASFVGLVLLPFLVWLGWPHVRYRTWGAVFLIWDIFVISWVVAGPS